MTNRAACPDPELLSQFLDRELAVTEEKYLVHHLATCSQCRSQVEDLVQTEGIARTQIPVLQQHLFSPAKPSSCPSFEEVTAYMDGLPPAEGASQIEDHLRTCNHCLQEAQEAAHVLFFLSSPHNAPTPAALKAQVAAFWKPLSAEEPATSLPRLVIHLAERGLRLLESYLVPPLLSIREVSTPASTYRSGDSSSVLSLRLGAKDVEIALLAVPEEAGVTLTLTFAGPERITLSNRRIFLRKQGALVLRRDTDEEGKLRIPPLEPGIYEVSCHEVFPTFQLELRS